jgi:hypothetical protein
VVVASHNTAQTQKRQTPKLGNGSPADIPPHAEFSPEGFASPSFEEFAFIVDIALNPIHRQDIQGSLGLGGRFFGFFAASTGAPYIAAGKKAADEPFLSAPTVSIGTVLASINTEDKHLLLLP